MRNISIKYLTAVSAALILAFVQFLSMPAGAQQCRPNEVLINCGRGPQCATRPAVCCYGQTCGAGMVCTQTARGPECGMPKVTRCGIYTCGEGMTCVQTPRGPECATPGGSQVSRIPPLPPKPGAPKPQGPAATSKTIAQAAVLIATQPDQEPGYTETWTRKGKTNEFDVFGKFGPPFPVSVSFHNSAAIAIAGGTVTVTRGALTFTGTLSADGRSATMTSRRSSMKDSQGRPYITNDKLNLFTLTAK